MGEVTSYSSSYGSTALFGDTITRDALGRISTKSETISGTTTTFAYTYDSAGRLTDVSQNGVAYSHYGFDTNSNRVSGNQGGTSLTATYDAQDRLLTYNTKSYSYNLNGENTSRTDSATGITNTLSYDAFGNLRTFTVPSGTVSYSFDGLGRRSVKTLGTTVKQRYIYRDQYRIAAILTAAGVISQRFVYGTRGNAPDYMLVGSTKYRFVTDQNGSVRLVVNTSTGAITEQITYDEFGQVLTDTNAGFQPFGFAGGLYDQDTKLVHFGARDYDPSVGRWISKDPILFGGGDSNLYGYVQNDPINWIDPSGLVGPNLLMPMEGGTGGGADPNCDIGIEMDGAPTGGGGPSVSGGGVPSEGGGSGASVGEGGTVYVSPNGQAAYAPPGSIVNPARNNTGTVVTIVPDTQIRLMDPNPMSPMGYGKYNVNGQFMDGNGNWLPPGSANSPAAHIQPVPKPTE